MVFRRSTSSESVAGFSSTQPEVPENRNARFRSSSVSAQEGKSYLGTSSQLQRLPTALSERTVKHITTVKACITLARLLAGVSQSARSFVVSRSQDLVYTLLQNNTPQARESAHKLIDKLDRQQKEQNEDLADWRCNAYSQLGQQYAEANDTDKLIQIAESMENELSHCSSSHSRLVRMSLANTCQTIAEQTMNLKTLAANKKAANYVVNIARFSNDATVQEWQIQRATDLLKPITSSSSPDVRHFAVQFMKDLENNASDPLKVNQFLQPYKFDIAPTAFATEHLSSDETIEMKADNSTAPQKVVVYGRNSDQMIQRVETSYQLNGHVKASDNSYKQLPFNSGSIDIMASEPVSQSEASLVARQRLAKRFDAGDITQLPSQGTDYTMAQLDPGESDRILFYTDIDAPYRQREQWLSDLQNFAVMLNCDPVNKQSRWQRVRFLINCDGLTNPSDINFRRQGIMDDVNRLLKPMGLTMDEGHFAMTATLSRELPEAYRDDFHRQFTPGAEMTFSEHHQRG
ncbi:hypothetical protein GZ77_17300 [Endozoicomonas montiporae]|uniref:Uncharacterized protein n=2 Tax=Endozoicomonas montiporae TaxID=1027273 RepID=A0A081N1J3_9GAMM|nr:hypothetical protein [Endozoicomonas montiporae]AMO58754.1 hypothetical protein EZMO1_4860 [Endozoicomonas montiporae CL-33]KEQ12316.1 hypothetical protein GZ77_17300 [Endozoicomonas montiporae]